MTVQLPRRMLDWLRAEASARQVATAMHPKQRAFFDDPCSRKAICSGRRGGKTRGDGAWLVDGMLKKPGTRQFYITLSSSLGRQILWDGALNRMRRDMGLPLELTSRAGHLMVEHPNGSSIWIAGCNDKSEVDKFRGQAPYRVVIDEAQGFGDYLEELVKDAIEPGLMDHRGSVAMTGTPSAAAVGFFHDVTTGAERGWSNHHLTILDNDRIPEYPTLESRIEYLRLKAEQLGGEDNPTFIREWLGRWCDDLQALIYPFTRENHWTPGRDPLTGEQQPEAPYGLPPGEYQFGLGVDLGFSERSTAFVLAANRIGFGELYVLRAYTRSRLIPTALAAHVRQVRDKLHSEAGKALRVVVDEGALGKGYAEQMRVLGVGCEAAVKTEKRAYQEWAAGLITSRKVLLHYAECRELIEEAARLQYDPETGLEDERFVRHCCDAFLYITRAMIPRYDPQQVPPEPGSPEAMRLEMKAIREQRIRDREKRNR